MPIVSEDIKASMNEAKNRDAKPASIGHLLTKWKQRWKSLRKRGNDEPGDGLGMAKGSL
ncbi:MAG: hypothetical protein IJ083_04740 [Clostridia bacterium]|nr:hypothetical protein [Clostridia bacterium]